MSCFSLLNKPDEPMSLNNEPDTVKHGPHVHPGPLPWVQAPTCEPTFPSKCDKNGFNWWLFAIILTLISLKVFLFLSNLWATNHEDLAHRLVVHTGQHVRQHLV